MTRTDSAPRVAIRREDYAPPDWLVDTVDLTLALDPDRTQVHARLHVRRNGQHDRPLVLDLDALEVLAVTLDGAPAAAVIGDTALTLPIAAHTAVVATRVAVAPRANTQLMGLYASGRLLCTQCEAEGFRRVTPFPDRPDVLSRYTVRLEANAARYPVLLAGGDRTAHGALPAGRHFATFTDPHPKPCYLFAAVAGDLAARADSFTTCSGKDVALTIWTQRADVPRSAHAMAALKAAMAWDEMNYGFEYDLAAFHIVAVDDFNFGAMENKGLNIFNSRYVLADEDTATDADFDAIAAVVAHEYFHNWTGNRITCRDWFQLALKEGLTVFRDQQFSADQGSSAVRRIEDVRALRAVQFAEDSGPLAHPVRPDSYVEIGNFYTATVYNKGAELIRMIHTLAGPARYRAGIDEYVRRHDGEAATVDQFVDAMAAGSGLDLTAFRRWYAQAGTPRVHASADTDGIVLTQSIPATPDQPDKLPVVIPLRVALFDRVTGVRRGDERLLTLTEANQHFPWPGADGALLSLNRGFSAPVIVDTPLSRADLAILARADDDPFARYEALQRLMRDALLAGIARGGPDGHAEIIAAVAATLDGPDPAFAAEAVLLPSETLIGDATERVDPDAVHTARESLRKALATALAERWWDVFHAAEPAGNAKGWRRLKGVALGYLAATDDDAVSAAAFLAFTDAANMTDRMAALTALAGGDAVERVEALRLFRAAYARDTNVMDKWFAVQAQSQRRDALADVVRLAADPLFASPNPNRLRSLVGAFTTNQVRFHRADGAGYAFVADQIIAADAVNPQPAARFTAAFGRWRRFDAARQVLMRAQLERILATKPSHDVYEIASKSLG